VKPVYFPFTYISKPVVDAFSRCFRQTVIYQPTSDSIPENIQRWEKNGLLELRIPLRGDEEKLAAILKDYKDWARLHHDARGLKNAFIRTRRETIPFFNETSASRIKELIKRGIQQRPSPAKADPIFNARLFLAIAQEFDLENERLRRDFSSIAAMENSLLKNIRGQEGHAHPITEKIGDGPTKTDDSGAYMMAERFQAWFQLMYFDRERGGDRSNLFVTSSRSALDHLLDSTGGAEKIFTIASLSADQKSNGGLEVWQKKLTDRLQRLTEISWPLPDAIRMDPPPDKAREPSASLTVYIVPGETPVALFSRCVGREFPVVGDAHTGSRSVNTLIGCLTGSLPCEPRLLRRG